MDDRLIGFRFYPTEEELVSFYLQHKLNGTRSPEIDRVIPLLDVYDYNPSDLPRLGGDCSPPDGDQWFFFIPRREREARGGRPNRLTSRGYWKATGSPGDVYSSLTGRVIGRKRTMVFYTGRAPHGRKTLWKMNEYKAVIQTTINYGPSFNSFSSTPAPPQLREELSLSRIYRRSKCLRAFDRRPPSVAARHHHHHLRNPEVVATFNTQQNIPAVAAHAHCSSGDILINNQSQSMEDNTENNQDYRATDNEPFWDWEAINLFDI